MKFTCTTEINLPVNKVVDLYSNTDNLSKWQDGFVSKELISGNAGQPNAKSRILMTFRNKKMELIETIQSNNLPSQITALYEHEHMINTMTSRFQSINDNKTTFNIDIHYTSFIGFIPKLMSVIMPGVFKKQTQKMVDSFKTFAES